MTTPETLPQPYFDPAHPGQSVDLMLPIRQQWLTGVRVGETVSKTRGQGYEINGIREYLPGEDGRHIDHLATARNPEGWPLVREHQAEISPSVWFVTDVFRKRYMANTGYCSEQILGLSALVALFGSADRQGFATAFIAADDTRLHQQTPALGRKHLRQARNQLSKITFDTPQTPVHEQQSMHTVIRRAARLATRSIVVIVSDFRDTDLFESSHDRPNWLSPLQKLASARNNGNSVVAVELTNPWDFAIPEQVESLWTGSQNVNLSGKRGRQIREHYQELGTQQASLISERLRNNGVDHITLSTDSPTWLTDLRQQLDVIAKRVKS